MDTPKAQNQKTINFFEVGDLVKSKNGTKPTGVIVKKLSEVNYGKPIYQIYWQNNTVQESYEIHENLEKHDEKRTIPEKV